MRGLMPEDTSQADVASEVDTSLLGTNTPVTDVAPVNNSSPTEQPSPEAKAGETTGSMPAAETVDVGGLDNDHYATAMAAFLCVESAIIAPVAEPENKRPKVPKTMSDLIIQHGLTATVCVDELVATEDEYKTVSRTALRSALSRCTERTGKWRDRLTKSATCV